MTVIPSLTAGLSRALNQQNTRVASSLHGLAPAARATPTSVEVSGLAANTTPQDPLAGLRVNAQTIAQARTLADVATAGIDHIAERLDRLQQLSIHASSKALPDTDREALNTEFQSVRRAIDQIARTTNFASQRLLDGSLAATGEGNLAIGNLTDQQLFGDAEVTLRTAENAQAAATAVTAAKTYVSDQRSAVATVGEELQFAAASVTSAIQNQEAARSTLSDADFAPAATESSGTKIRAEATAALLAQTNRLSPSALTLLVE